MAKVLVGLLEPTSGLARVAGHDVRPVTVRDPAARRRVQLVSQSPWSALNRAKTIRHIVTQPLQVHGLAPDRAAREARAVELLRLVGLPAEYLDRRPRDISGGELQRVTIARALAGEPQVLVLDEPTASLDVSVKAILVNLLADLRAELGLSYVLITHELDIARHLADRVAVMYLGKFVEVERRRGRLLPPGAPVHPVPAGGGAVGAAHRRTAAGAAGGRGALGGRRAQRLPVPHPVPVRHRAVPRTGPRTAAGAGWDHACPACASTRSPRRTGPSRRRQMTDTLAAQAGALRLHAGDWARRGVDERIAVLARWSAEIAARRPTLVAGLARDTGRLALSEMEVGAVLSSIERHSGWARELLAQGRSASSADGAVAIRDAPVPYGLVGCDLAVELPVAAGADRRGARVAGRLCGAGQTQ